MRTFAGIEGDEGELTRPMPLPAMRQAAADRGQPGRRLFDAPEQGEILDRIYPNRPRRPVANY